MVCVYYCQFTVSGRDRRDVDNVKVEEGGIER